jgi:hypothetical protein
MFCSSSKVSSFQLFLHFFVLSGFDLDFTACDYFQCHKISFQRLKAGTAARKARAAAAQPHFVIGNST